MIVHQNLNIKEKNKIEFSIVVWAFVFKIIQGW